MAQSPLDVLSKKPSALDYGTRQTLFFGGDPAYAFTLPDGSIVHTCGKGLAGLYRAIVWLQRDDIPKAKEMEMMLKTHKADPNYIVAYISKQVTEHLPDGHPIRTDLLAITESTDAPAVRVDRFMKYMDDIMPVVVRDTAILYSIVEGVKLRANLDNMVASDKDEGPAVVVKCVKEKMALLGYSYIKTLKAYFDDLFEPQQYAEAVSLLLQNDVDAVDTKELLVVAEDYLKKGNYPASKTMTVGIVRHTKEQLKLEEIRGLLQGFIDKNKVGDMGEIVVAAVSSGIEGVSSKDVEAWMKLMVTGANPRWDLYAQLALATVKSREVSGEQGRKKVLERQAFDDLAEAEELKMVLGWIAELKRNGEHASALALELELFRRQSDDERTSGVGVTAAAVKADLTESFAKIKPLFAQLNYIARASDEEAGKPAEPSETEKLIDSAVLAVEILGDAELGLDDILAWNKDTDFKSGLLLSAAIRRPSIARQLHIDRVLGFVTQAIAIGKERGMSGFLGQSAQFAAAAVESDFPGATGAVALSWLDTLYSAGGAPSSMPLLRAIIQKRAKLGLSDTQVLGKLNILVERKHYRALLEVLREMVDQGMPVPEDSMKSWMTLFLGADPEVASAAADLAVVALQKKAIPAADEETVKEWASKLVVRKMQVKALALGLVAQDTGIDMHEEDIQAWHHASYEGKTPEDAANNAIALIEVYRNRPAVRRLGLEQRQALEREIDEAFQKVKKHREELDSIATMPMSKVMGKIDAMIFGDG